MKARYCTRWRFQCTVLFRRPVSVATRLFTLRCCLALSMCLLALLYGITPTFQTDGGC